ncbi:hypothetical protein CYMTET_10090 [Cymbomonas tetramitiformis]|uniref:Uncharacterized protein n=1 Tax=Cymbomonas tetramitiformis TaxID=36881 RepID=A0AAE0GQ03_9CHLO|nr:hypothetical protein CYMTET_10090 [Cymbomonas tetramitiformis]
MSMWEEHITREDGDDVSEDYTDEGDSVATVTDDEMYATRRDGDRDAIEEEPEGDDETTRGWEWGGENVGEDVQMPQTLLNDTTLRMLPKIPRGLSLEDLFLMVISWTAFTAPSPSQPIRDAEIDSDGGDNGARGIDGESNIPDAEMVWGNGEDMLKEWVECTNTEMSLHRPRLNGEDMEKWDLVLHWYDEEECWRQANFSRSRDCGKGDEHVENGVGAFKSNRWAVDGYHVGLDGDLRGAMDAEFSEEAQNEDHETTNP